MVDGTGLPDFNTFVQVQLEFTAASFSACEVTSNSQVVGQAATWTITLTPAVSVQTSQVLVMTLPIWTSTTPSNFIKSTANCSSSCTNSIQSPSEIVTISNLFQTAGVEPVTFSITTALNPVSTYPISVSFTITTSDASTVQTCSSTFSVSSPSVLTNVTFVNSNRRISGTNQVIFYGFTSTPLASGAYLRASTSLGLSYTYVPLTPNKLQRVATTDGTLLLSNLTSTSVNAQYPLTVGNYTLTNPKYSNKSVSVVFSTEAFINGSFYKIDMATISITADPSTITTAAVTIPTKGINLISSYSVSFTTVNALLGTSTIIIVFPS